MPDLQYTVIADPNKSLFKAFGVETSIKSLLSPSAWLAGINGVFNHGLHLPARGESALGLPADFLIDQNGRIVALKYAKHAYDQWSVDELCQQCSMITSRE